MVIVANGVEGVRTWKGYWGLLLTQFAFAEITEVLDSWGDSWYATDLLAELLEILFEDELSSLDYYLVEFDLAYELLMDWD